MEGEVGRGGDSNLRPVGMSLGTEDFKSDV